jgi:hypothetical protein
VLIALTAAATTGLAPWISDLWSEHDKSVESSRIEKTRQADEKTALVRQIGVASGLFLVNAETLDLSSKPHLLDDSFQKFEQSSFDISSQLAAYEPGSKAATRWGAFDYSIRNAYNLLIAQSTKARSMWIYRLSGYFRRPANIIDGLCGESGAGPYDDARRTLVLQFQHREADVLSAVIAYPKEISPTPKGTTPDQAACSHVKTSKSPHATQH